MGGSGSRQIPIDLANSVLEDSLKETLSTPPGLKSPPFEKELQVAGLFAPCYLPLLEDRRIDPAPHSPAEPPPPPPPMADNAKSSPNGSPPVPLASSLKSSSGSYFDASGRSGRKPKSPKKVTFQFDDESSVPSRSSPPPTKLVWSFGAVEGGGDDHDGGDDDDDYEEVDDGDDGFQELALDHLRDEDYGSDDLGFVQQVEDVAGPAPLAAALDSLSHFPRSHGDQLVTPLAFATGTFGTADPSVRPAVVSPDLNPGPTVTPSPKTAENWMRLLRSPTAAAPPSTPAPATTTTDGNGIMGRNDNGRVDDKDAADAAAAAAAADDDDDEGLFDLDETVPGESHQTPPHRDLSPLFEAQLAAQQLPPQATASNLPSSLRAPTSYAPPPPTTATTTAATAVPLPSGSFDPITFGKSPVTTTPFPPQHKSAFSASFTHSPLQLGRRPPAPMASSLPAAQSSEGGRFRRRSINKYIPSPPPEEDSGLVADADAAARDKTPSPYGTSVPITITPRISSLRSPPASTSPLNRAPGSGSGLGAEDRAEPAKPTPFHVDTTADTLAAVASPPRNSSEVESYLRTARFPSAAISPYRTKFAQELAQQALLDGDDVGESIVGGVDGRTGLDPESFSVRAHVRTGSLAGQPWTLSARMAVEDDEVAAKRP